MLIKKSQEDDAYNDDWAVDRKGRGGGGGGDLVRLKQSTDRNFNRTQPHIPNQQRSSSTSLASSSGSNILELMYVQKEWSGVNVYAGEININ